MIFLESFREDFLPIVLSAVWVLAVLGFAEICRAQGIRREFTRKIVHVGIGLWIVPTFMLFEHRMWAVLPAVLFIFFNAAIWQLGFMRSMEGERRNIGVILYPFSTALALFLFWTPPWPVVGASAILVMAWGDAAGALIGQSFGRHHYEVFGHRRSLEGSAAMFTASVAAILAVFLGMGAPVTGGTFQIALIASALATLVEAVSPWGLDNFLIPCVVAVSMTLLRTAVWG